LCQRETIDLRSASKTSDLNANATKEERVLGDKAVNGIDNDNDHIPNIISGLKAAISNPNMSAKGKNQAEPKLDAIT